MFSEAPKLHLVFRSIGSYLYPDFSIFGHQKYSSKQPVSHDSDSKGELTTRSKSTKILFAVVVLSLAVITMAGGVQWTKSSLANPSGQEREKRNLKDEVLIPIDAAPDEVDADKREARTKK